MTITYKLEPDDLRAFQRYGQKHLPSGRRANYIMAVATVAGSLLLTLISDDHRTGFRIAYFCFLLLVYWVFMRVLMFVFLRILQWRVFTSEKHRSTICEHTVTLADDALVEATPFNESRNLWIGIYRVVDAADYIYIFTSLHSAHIIPKRAFTNAESIRQFYERATSLHSASHRAAAQPSATAT